MCSRVRSSIYEAIQCMYILFVHNCAMHLDWRHAAMKGGYFICTRSQIIYEHIDMIDTA